MGFFECVVILTGFGTTTGVLVEYIKHRTRIAQLKIEAQHRTDADVRAALDDLRTEMRALRDTTMQYDLSFDTALQRMERRVEGLERRSLTADASASLDLRSGR
jgi:hypothetical protein